MTNFLIRATGISRSFGKRKILDNLNFSLKEGEMVAIVGLSGAGKSTLLNILGLLDNKFEGSLICLDNEIIPGKEYSFIRKEHMGFVFQSYYLLPKYSVKQNILMPYAYKNTDVSEKNEELNEVCKRLKIDILLDQNSEDLSGGEKQRVAIARAILDKPEIIICDEPTGNLDEMNTRIVLDTLKEETKRGAGIVIVTHNRFLAEQCDKTYYLRGGQLHDKDA